MIEGLSNAIKEVTEVVKAKIDVMPDFFKDVRYDKDVDINKPVDLKDSGNDVQKKDPLTDEQKKEIKEVSGYSDEVIDCIGSWKGYKIYRDAGLKEVEIDGRKCLIRDDIAWNQKDELGRTNKERVESRPPDGPLSPINKNGETIELHHIGQKSDSPLAELTKSEHILNGNYSVLHDTSKKISEIDRNEFNKEKKDHWLTRANEGGV